MKTKSCKTKTAIFGLLSLIIILTGCTLSNDSSSFSIFGSRLLPVVKGSGNIVSEKRDLNNFNAIRTGGITNTFVIIGDEWKVEVIADDNIIEYLETKVRNNTLYIGQNNVNLKDVSKFNVHVTLPSIHDVRASGTSTVNLKLSLTER